MEENQYSDFQLVDDPSQLGVQQEETSQPVVEPTADQQTEQPEVQETNEPQEVSTPDQPERTFDAVLGRVDDFSNDQQELTSNEQSSQYTQEDVDRAVAQYVSAKLGREISSLDDLSSLSQRKLDERVETIARFVEETGRDPFDWFRYQAINPSEMDDMAVVKMDLMTRYPQLSQDEVELMVSNKYKVNQEFGDESSAKMAQLQLKMDAAQAREGIERIRESFKAPEQVQQQQSVVNEDWVRSMAAEVDQFDGIEFDLMEGKSFSFGLDEKYKSELVRKNAQIENYFDDYISDEGDWDFEKLTAHRTIIDNIDNIVQAVYKQGLGDGQKGIVDMAANVQSSRPNVSGDVSSESSILDQVAPFFQNKTMTFNI